MNKRIRLFILIALMVLLLALASLAAPYIFTAFVIKEVTDRVDETYSYTMSDIKAYVEEKHGIDVRVGHIEKPAGVFSEVWAIVETKDEDSFEFMIEFNARNHISGDNYELMSNLHTFNNEFESSDLYKPLNNKVLESYLTVEEMDGSGEEEVTLYLVLPEENAFEEIDTLKEAEAMLPHLKAIQSYLDDEYNIDLHKASLKLYSEEYDTLFIDKIVINLDDEYKSFDDFNKKIATDNVEFYSRHLSSPIVDELESIAGDLKSIDFANEKINRALLCDDIHSIEHCESFTLTLEEKGENSDESPFKYDNATVKEDLFHVIERIKIPVNYIVINNLNVPEFGEDQDYDEETLKEQDEEVELESKKVKIEQLEDINSVSDIYFNY